MCKLYLCVVNRIYHMYLFTTIAVKFHFCAAKFINQNHISTDPYIQYTKSGQQFYICQYALYKQVLQKNRFWHENHSSTKTE